MPETNRNRSHLLLATRDNGELLAPLFDGIFVRNAHFVRDIRAETARTLLHLPLTLRKAAFRQLSLLIPLSEQGLSRLRIPTPFGVPIGRRACSQNESVAQFFQTSLQSGIRLSATQMDA